MGYYTAEFLVSYLFFEESSLKTRQERVSINKFSARLRQAQTDNFYIGESNNFSLCEPDHCSTVNLSKIYQPVFDKLRLTTFMLMNLSIILLPSILNFTVSLSLSKTG